MREFLLSFVPLFVAMDALGVLPIFITLTEGLDKSAVRRTIWQSVFTAMAVALLFLAVGKAVLDLLGITIADFMVAGGLLLFGISISELLQTEKVQRRAEGEALGAVPLGVPLLVGPGVLTTTILLVNEYGLAPTVLATVANVLVAGLIFMLSQPIHRRLGKAGTRAISKLSALILASIGVMMVRRGIEAFLSLY